MIEFDMRLPEIRRLSSRDLNFYLRAARRKQAAAAQLLGAIPGAGSGSGTYSAPDDRTMDPLTAEAEAMVLRAGGLTTLPQ